MGRPRYHEHNSHLVDTRLRTPDGDFYYAMELLEGATREKPRLVQERALPKSPLDNRNVQRLCSPTWQTFLWFSMGDRGQPSE